jgi:hypothetical protein
MQISLGNPLIVTMGMGQEKLLEPGLAVMGAVEYFQIIEAIREALKGDGAPYDFDDGIEIYKLAAILQEVNSRPLSNPLFNKITRLIYDKKIKIGVSLTDQISRKSNPYRIVIGEHRIIRESDE